MSVLVLIVNSLIQWSSRTVVFTCSQTASRSPSTAPLQKPRRGVLTLMDPDWICIGRVVIPWLEVEEADMVVFVVVVERPAYIQQSTKSRVSRQISYLTPGFSATASNFSLRFREYETEHLLYQIKNFYYFDSETRLVRYNHYLLTLLIRSQLN